MTDAFNLKPIHVRCNASQRFALQCKLCIASEALILKLQMTVFKFHYTRIGLK